MAKPDLLPAEDPAGQGRLGGLAFSLRKSLEFADGPGSLGLALTLPVGHWLALLGPSGSGKTTVLRLLAGLLPADVGHLQVGSDVWLDTARGIDIPTRCRRLGFVFQDLALFPHMTVQGNVAFALARNEPPSRTMELLELVRLGRLAGRYPAQLSGGQRQRLALARALAPRPRLLLLDEPLSAQDRQLRTEMQELLCEIRKRNLVDNAVLVTHDEAEAERLTDLPARIVRGNLHT